SWREIGLVEGEEETTVCHTSIIQQFHVVGHCTLFKYSLFGQESMCLALSVCCCLWSFIVTAELNCGISKGMSVGHEPFLDPSQI
uniref:Uncharacterized protein n=1 Tax=Echeneis naucrates TaxID=173247 RepID=A0A665XCD6_ECHNA